MLDLHALYTIEYAKEHDTNYGKCCTCRYQKNCKYGSGCGNGAAYKFDLVPYQKKHDEEIAKWIEERRK